ncbi:GNAT family N-acetyltransferase [Ruegeria sp. 2012CJ41-6]|uniref:GNAT family N-acetyltransferase n=1 Tax=Ruegeria spongiae TaxID=2942209 RepID=A0ABT0Q785_9RHOB|nr:GNAT family N-acetyltransferase [Ruegeria spongiae]MCL6285693.1 GNAT family N-acetyltransferase [Ruegeria spongiae]
MIEIRPARAQDLDAYYRISLLTGDRGADATALFAEPKLMGHIYSAPYLLFARDLCLSVVDEGAVVGFCIGAGETTVFRQTLERDWWPPLRAAHPMPDLSRRKSWTADERRIAAIYNPVFAPRTITDRYPAHVHMNLLPRYQGLGIGTRLLQAWFGIVRTRGADAVHLGANPENPSSIAFWRGQGFVHLPVEGDRRTYWMAQDLPLT